jgi:two-component system osmolarity sensor histidine kinase EnvZ
MTSIGFTRLVQKPRADQLSSLIAAQIVTVNTALAIMSPTERSLYIARLDSQRDGDMGVGKPDPKTFSQPKPEIGKYFMQRMHDRLPGSNISFSLIPVPQLWIPLEGYQGSLWLRLSLERFLTVAPAVWATWVSSVAVLVVLVSLFMLLQFRRKLAALDLAIDELSDSSDSQTQAVPAGPSDDLDRLTRRLEEVSSHLIRANNQRQLMLAGVSHDLRTVLTKLRISLELERVEDDIRPLKYLAQAERFVSQFLDFSRTPEDEPAVFMDMNDVIREVCATAQADGHNVELILADLPHMNVRPMQMVRMLSNLLENALHYGKEPIEVHTGIHGAELTICVMDRGPGVTEQDLEHLTKPYFRGQGAQSRTSGSGLGLAIVSEAAKSLGGELALRQRPGGGFIAALRLPITRSGTGTEPAELLSKLSHGNICNNSGFVVTP